MTNMNAGMGNFTNVGRASGKSSHPGALGQLVPKVSDEVAINNDLEVGTILTPSVIHPAQIATINEVLTPTEEEVAKARQVLVVNRQGVGSVDGKMVDEAIAPKARLILERAGIAAEDKVFSSSTDMKNK